MTGTLRIVGSSIFLTERPSLPTMAFIASDCRQSRVCGGLTCRCRCLPVIDGTVLISDSDLAGIEFGDGELNPYDSFRRMNPTAVIEGGVYAYTGRFAIPLAAALTDVHDSQKLLSAGKTQEAMAKATEAAQLAPGSAKVQEALADALAASGKASDALTHYEIAFKSAQTVRPDLQEDVVKDVSDKIAKAQPATR